MGVKCIVVGTDGSEHARRASRWAADLAAQTGAEVVAVHAVGLLVNTPAGPVPNTPALHESCESSSRASGPTNSGPPGCPSGAGWRKAAP
ncbi:MAG: Universal stress protein family [Actinomycetota bacterium]|nr:Universal stress protein family [Actinomycetota bacterium]